MKNINEIKQLEELSALKLTEEERNCLEKEMFRFAKYFDQLGTYDLESIDPMVTVHESHSIVREDFVETHLERNDVFFNTAVKEENYFKVPLVIDKK